MAIDYANLKAWSFTDLEHRVTSKDVILYALGIGLGSDPCDMREIPFVQEDGLRALPTFPLAMSHPGLWFKDPATGIDWTRVLNGEQGIEIIRPFPAAGSFVSRNHIDEVVDKGPGGSALIYTTREVLDAATGDLYCKLTQTIFCRGQGGFGGAGVAPRKTSAAIPDTQPTLSLTVKTLPQAALIYRLTGDWHPVHADPRAARAAGFDRPILHGAALFGMAGWLMTQLLGDSDPAALRSMNARFAAPVYPGESIRFDIWTTSPGTALFRAHVVERNLIALDNGFAQTQGDMQ